MTDYKAILRTQREKIKVDLANVEHQRDTAFKMLSRLKEDIQSTNDIKELKEHSERLVRFVDGITDMDEQITFLKHQLKETNNWNI